MGGEETTQQTLIEHLSELRKRLIWSLGFIAIGFFVAWAFSESLFDIIRAPILPHLKAGGLVFTAPMDKFMAHIKVSLLGGFILTAPLWVHQMWLFVAPGLYANEKKYGLVFIFSGTTLFLTGVSFVYFVVYPMAFEFLMNFGGEVDSPMITIGEYLSFFVTTTLVFGLAFEMPLILTILGMLGVVTHAGLVKYRRFAIVGLEAMSAILTTPDVISMVLIMVTIVYIYELSIIMIKIFGQPPRST